MLSVPFNKTCLAALLGFSSMILASPTQAATQVAQPMYPWKTESSADPKTKTLRHCLVKNVFDNATLLILAENDEGIQRLAVHFTEDRLEQGVLVDLTMQVDSGDVFPVEGMTTTPRILAINMPEMLPEQMRKGKILRIRGPQDEIAYNLKGTDKAVMSLRDCVASHKNPNAAKQALADVRETEKQTATNLAKSSVFKSPEPVSAPAPVQQAPITSAPIDTAPVARIAEATPVKKSATPLKTAAIPAQDGVGTPWTTFFSLVGLKPNNDALSDAKTLRIVPPLAHAWMSGAYDIGFQNTAPLNGKSFDTHVQSYLSGMKRSCLGKFIAEASAPATTTNGKIRWQIAETICSNKGTDIMSALLFTSSAGDAVTMTIRSDMKNAAEAIRKRNAFFDLIRNAD